MDEHRANGMTERHLIEEIAERQRDAALDLAATQKAVAILRKGGGEGATGAPVGEAEPLRNAP